MAFPTAIDTQITDSVPPTNTEVLGDTPGAAVGHLYAATARALSYAADNAAEAQQQDNAAADAATTAAVSTLLTLDADATGVATKEVFGS